MAEKKATAKKAGTEELTKGVETTGSHIRRLVGAGFTPEQAKAILAVVGSK